MSCRCWRGERSNNRKEHTGQCHSQCCTLRRTPRWNWAVGPEWTGKAWPALANTRPCVRRWPPLSPARLCFSCWFVLPQIGREGMTFLRDVRFASGAFPAQPRTRPKRRGANSTHPSLKAPRSARPEKHAKPRPMGAYSATGLSTKNSRFLSEAVAEATLNVCYYSDSVIFRLRSATKVHKLLAASERFPKRSESCFWQHLICRYCAGPR
jgi:hypothetical protein